LERIEDYIKLTDDHDYQTRIKVNNDDSLSDRSDLSNFEDTPRERKHIEKCDNCIYKNQCWGPAFFYKELY